MLRKIRNILRQPAPYVTYTLNLIRKSFRTVRFRFSVKHIFGPSRIQCRPDGCIVVCTVRNGEEYIAAFIEHYLSLGVDHIVFLDNGSTDRTLDIARRFPRITMLRSVLPFKHYKHIMKNYLIFKYARHNWSLIADIDEFFDYPLSDCLSLNQLIRYLDQYQYTSVMGHMLDMFPSQNLVEVQQHPDQDFRATHCYYDLTNITKTSYPQPNNVVSNPRVQWYEGGIRATAFGVVENTLTKNPLLIAKGALNLPDSHRVQNARIADFSCVLYHYKFTHRFFSRTDEAVQRGQHFKDSRAYKRIQAVLMQNPAVMLYGDTSQKLNSVQDLVDQDFLVVSDQYLAWAHKQ